MGSKGLDKLKALEAQVQASYPDLRLVFDGETALLRGSFPVREGEDEIDRFQIEVSVEPNSDGLPTVREIGGRIPWLMDRHVEGDGKICPDVPELILLHGTPTILEYLDGPVRNFFLSQLTYEETKVWPFDEWQHGRSGVIQAYGNLLGLSTEDEIKRHLDYLSRREIKGHWPCPCGSGEKMRKCHPDAISTLRERIPRHVAAMALRRLMQLGGSSRKT